MTARAPIYNETRPVRLWARFEPPSVEKLDRYADHRGVTRSGLMRLIIEQWLAARPDIPEGSPIAGGRSYDQSPYMKARQEARERAVLTKVAAQAVRGAQEDLEARFQEIAQVLREAAQAVRAVADLGEVEEEEKT